MAVTKLFVTGTGTDVGKTYCTAMLVRQLRARGVGVGVFKPVMSGFGDGAKIAESDAGVLLSAAGRAATLEEIEAISPWRYAAALAPNLAARKEGRRVDLGEVLAFCREKEREGYECLIVEGAGGVMSPVTDGETVLDWMAGLGWPALLVAGSYLGSMTHCLTALVALRDRGVRVCGVVVSESARADGESKNGFEEGVEVLRSFLPAGLPVRTVRRGRETDLTPLLPPPPPPSAPLCPPLPPL